MYQSIFGPVLSRRLGMSLGIDLVPHKLCSMYCVYCECGRTTALSLERQEYVPYEKVTRGIAHYLSHNPRPDTITFSGSGEPRSTSASGMCCISLNTAAGRQGPFLQNRAIAAEVDRMAKSGIVMASTGDRAKINFRAFLWHAVFLALSILFPAPLNGPAMRSSP